MLNKIIIVLTFLLTSCNTLDNYMLGEDNTPAPRTLKPLTSELSAKPKWQVPMSAHSKRTNKDNLHATIVEDVVYSADNAGTVMAVEKQNGRIRWQKKLAHGLLSGPSVQSGILVLATDDAQLIAMKAQNGEIIWQQKLSSNAYAPPSIGYERVLAKTIDGNLYAFDLRQGKKVWRARHGAPSLVLKAASKPVIVDAHLVVAGFADGKIDAYDLENGTLLWTRRVVYGRGSSEIERLVDIDTDPIIQNRVMYLGSYHRFVGAMSLDDGHMLWEKPISVYKNMTLNNNTLYVVDLNDVIWAINAKNGEKLWKQTAFKHHDLTAPAVNGSFIVLGDNSANMIHWLSKKNGELKGRLLTPARANASPLFSGKDLIVASEGGLSSFDVT